MGKRKGKGKGKGKGKKEKVVYIHVISMAKCMKESKDEEEVGYRDATNDWYVIKPSSSEGGGAEISRVFKDANKLNERGGALLDTGCEVIDSTIYIIGGRSAIDEYLGINTGSKYIRSLDTRRPHQGWTTSSTLPFSRSMGTSAVVDNSWLYLFNGKRHDGCRTPDPWCYALNVLDQNTDVRSISRPDFSYFPPVLSVYLSPSKKLVAYMVKEKTLYELDCSEGGGDWAVYDPDFPCRDSVVISSYAVSDEGVLYMYDTVAMKLILYDFALKKELPSVDLPRTFWFGFEQYVKLFYLCKDKFCIIWNGYGEAVNELCVYYTRFSISHDLPNKPTVVLEDNQLFEIDGFKLVNIVTV